MNFVSKSSLLSLALVCGTAMATNFSGPEAGVSVTMNGGAIKYQETGKKQSILGGSSLGFRLHGGYGFDMGNDTVVLVGFDYNATDSLVGKSSDKDMKINQV